MQICLLSVLLMAALARATEVNLHNAGSYHKEFMDGTSRVVQDFVAEGDVEFYGALNDVKQEEGDRGSNEEDDDIEVLGSIYDLFENSKEAHYIENYDNVLFDTLATHDVHFDHRDLLVDIPHVHCDCGSDKQSFFNVEIKITPSQDALPYKCDARKQRRLGNAINAMLLDLGVGDAGAGDDVVFVATVCNTPSHARRLLLDGSQDDEDDMGDVDNMEKETGEEADNERELAITLKGSSFVYSGGGPCRGCPGDNLDHRRNLQTAYSSECVPLPSGKMSCKITASEEICDDSGCSTVQSFCRAHVESLDSMADVCECQFDFWDFLIDLNEKIKTYTLDGIVPNHRHCCGTEPEITITTKEVSEHQVNFGC